MTVALLAVVAISPHVVELLTMRWGLGERTACALVVGLVAAAFAGSLLIIEPQVSLARRALAAGIGWLAVILLWRGDRADRQRRRSPFACEWRSRRWPAPHDAGR